MRVRVVLMTTAALSIANCGSEENGTADDEALSTTPTATAQTTGDEAAASIDGYEVTADLPYAEEVMLDVYRPTVDGPWPVMVFAGGRTKETAEAFGKSYAEGGAVAYVVTMPDEPPGLDTVEGLACAVRYARATAAEHGGDPDNVTLVGFSLGASAGAVAALSGDDHTTGCVEAGPSALPDGFIGYEGAYDWAHTDYPLDLELLEQEDPVQWAAIDPYAHVDKNPDLTVRLIHGVDENADWYEVPPAVSEDFQQALVDAGHDAEVILLEGAGHSLGFPGIPQFDAMVAQAMIVAESN